MDKNIIEQYFQQINYASKENLSFENEMELLSKLDFKDENVIDEANKFIKKIINKIKLKEPILDIDAQLTTYIEAKLYLAQNDLDDVSIKYFDPKVENNVAYYRPTDNSINIPQNYISTEKGRFSFLTKDAVIGNLERLGLFMHLSMHEIRHAYQQKIVNQAKEKGVYTKNAYIYERENLVLLLGNWYQDTKNSNNSKLGNIYDTNHDSFLIELDANYTSYHDSLKRAKELDDSLFGAIKNPRALCIGFHHPEKNLLDEFDKVTWQHDTNPNQKPVRAEYKANSIISYAIEHMNDKERKDYFSQYPTLNLTHNKNGTKKTLVDIEKEFMNCQKQLDKSKTSIEEKNNLFELYNTIIEGDPLLSFERSLRKIACINKKYDHYFNYSNQPEYIDKRFTYNEIENAMKKAEDIIQNIEDFQLPQVRKLISQYKGKINNSLKTFNLDEYNHKALSLSRIELQLSKNNDFKKEMDKEREQEKLKKESIEIIKKVFPDFVPEEYKGEIQQNNQVVLVPNVEEKAILYKGAENYIKSYFNLPQSTIFNLIPYESLKKAIDTAYPFELNDKIITNINEKIADGTLKIPNNLFDLNTIKTATPQQPLRKKIEETLIK